MTNQNRTELTQQLFQEIVELMKNKGAAYSGNQDVNSNFKKLASELGLSKYQVWAVYFMKHIHSIINAIEDNPYCPVERTEGLHGRIKDAIAYLAILYSLVEDN